MAIGQASSTSAGLSLQSFNDDVYLGYATSGGVTVQRSRDRGVAFSGTPVNLSIAFFDVLYDPTDGALAAAASNSTGCRPAARPSTRRAR